MEQGPGREWDSDKFILIQNDLDFQKTYYKFRMIQPSESI